MFTDNKITLSASFSKDSVFVGDSLKIMLFFKNNSNDTLKLYPEGWICIWHYHPNVFISYENPERMMYILREHSNPEKIVWLNPGEEYQELYDILAKDSFFYNGENSIYVIYRNFFEKLSKKKKHQKKIQESTIILNSRVFKLLVTTAHRSA